MVLVMGLGRDRYIRLIFTIFYLSALTDIPL